MADSEDEYDRKRRDKFRGERTESYQRGEGRRGGASEERRRDDWIDRESWGSRSRPRTEYREYRGGGGRERYSAAHSQDIVQPMKRMKTEWYDVNQSPDNLYKIASDFGLMGNWSPPDDGFYYDFIDLVKEDRRGGGYSHDNSGGYNYRNQWMQESYVPQHNYSGNFNNQKELQTDTQPPMMSFKAFLQTQDDNITDDEAIRKYNEYKLEFKRQQLNEFFMAHKDEECIKSMPFIIKPASVAAWSERLYSQYIRLLITGGRGLIPVRFKIKYHPEDSVRRKDEQSASLKHRLEVFIEFLESDRLDAVSVDAHQQEQLITLLDAVVIRLEGGTELDLQILEAPPPEPPAEDKVDSTTGDKPESKEGEISDDEDKKSEEGDKDSEISDKEAAEPKLDEIVPEPELKPNTEVKKTLKEEKTKNAVEVEEIAEVVEKDNKDDEPPPPGLEAPAVGSPTPASEPEEEETPHGEKRKRSLSEDMDLDTTNEMEDISDKEDSSLKLDKPEDGEVKKENTREEGEEEGVAREEGERKEEEEELKPRPLHRTASIFLRNLAPTITKQEVEAMCKRYPGFLRVAIADPQQDRRWFRRGWVTFQRSVNIKEICWNLNNIRLRDCELGAIVNRDLSRRIRTVNGITAHRQVVRHDIKLSARIVHNLDARSGLWSESGEEKVVEQVAAKKDSGPIWTKDSKSFGLLSKNPVMKNITDYLIEEASAEEEELLGHGGDHEDGQLADDAATFDRDEGLIKVLDKLLLYLRIVHSVDYYNHCEYPNEDEMPNRCGIMHARSIPPISKVSQQEISDYCRMFEQKVASFLQPNTIVTDEDYSKLGYKDPDMYPYKDITRPCQTILLELIIVHVYLDSRLSEVEKFVQANTQELAKDKWLCPLSGKKFKGPEFVRKHIFNKHAEKVEEVKKEVEYFNNYLRDPKRPQLPEHPGKRPQRGEGTPESQGFSAPAPYLPHYQYNSFARHGGYGGHPYGGYGYNQGYGRGRGYNRGRGGGDYRPVIHYRDLDAPRETEEII
uniref:Serrate RNA effector molecule homolog n=1 Tax=Timema tahoe TaxID=61484 RepID=A0A7R9FFK2_9NEOP|nr:unnamed protein product [Timema tahoe]